MLSYMILKQFNKFSVIKINTTHTSCVKIEILNLIYILINMLEIKKDRNQHENVLGIFANSISSPNHATNAQLLNIHT